MARTVRIDLWTIGYERRSPDELVAVLRRARIDRLIDVRELPLSRRKGFSKNGLRATLAAAGVDYVHLRSAGNPFRHDADSLALYRERLEHSPDVTIEVMEAIAGHRSCLLCFEHDPATCHRTILASFVATRMPLAIKNL